MRIIIKINLYTQMTVITPTKIQIKILQDCLICLTMEDITTKVEDCLIIYLVEEIIKIIKGVMAIMIEEEDYLIICLVEETIKIIMVVMAQIIEVVDYLIICLVEVVMEILVDMGVTADTLLEEVGEEVCLICFQEWTFIKF